MVFKFSNGGQTTEGQTEGFYKSLPIEESKFYSYEVVTEFFCAIGRNLWVIEIGGIVGNWILDSGILHFIVGGNHKMYLVFQAEFHTEGSWW